MTRNRRVADESALTTFFRRHTELAKRVLKGASNLSYLNRELQKLIESIPSVDQELQKRLEDFELALDVGFAVHSPWRGRTYPGVCDDCGQNEGVLLHGTLRFDEEWRDDRHEFIDIYFMHDGRAKLLFSGDPYQEAAVTPSSIEMMRDGFMGTWEEAFKKAIAFLKKHRDEISSGGLSFAEMREKGGE